MLACVEPLIVSLLHCHFLHVSVAMLMHPTCLTTYMCLCLINDSLFFHRLCNALQTLWIQLECQCVSLSSEAVGCWAAVPCCGVSPSPCHVHCNASLPTGLVKMSTKLSSVLMYLILTFPSCMLSLMKWYLVSICFNFQCCAGSLLTWMVPVLSEKIMGVPTSTLMALKRCPKKRISHVASVTATDSASTANKAVQRCSADFHATRFPCKKTADPDELLHCAMVSLDQFASLCATRKSCCLSLQYCKWMSWVPSKYWSTLCAAL